MGFAPGGFARVNTRLSGSPAFTKNPFQGTVPAQSTGPVWTARLSGGSEMSSLSGAPAEEADLSLKRPEEQKPAERELDRSKQTICLVLGSLQATNSDTTEFVLSRRQPCNRT